MIRVLIADDHNLMRAGLKYFFGLSEDLRVVDEARDGNQVLERLQGISVDLLLLDLRMPGIDGEELIPLVVALYPKVSILVFSVLDEPYFAQRVMRAGAAGFLSKAREPHDLLVAIRQVVSGGRYLDPVVAQQLAAESTGNPWPPLLDSLTDREYQVMRLLAAGQSINQIAELLCISNKTVSTHKTRLMGKLGFLGMADLVRYAQAHNVN